MLRSASKASQIISGISFVIIWYILQFWSFTVSYLLFIVSHSPETRDYNLRDPIHGKRVHCLKDLRVLLWNCAMFMLKFLHLLVAVKNFSRLRCIWRILLSRQDPLFFYTNKNIFYGLIRICRLGSIAMLSNCLPYLACF